MSFATMVAITNSAGLSDRIRMCVASLFKADHTAVQPAWWVATHIDRIAVTESWVPLWEASNLDDPGADDQVITDSMILEVVKSLRDEDAETLLAEQMAKEIEDAKFQAKAEAEDQKRRDNDLAYQQQLEQQTRKIYEEDNR